MIKYFYCYNDKNITNRGIIHKILEIITIYEQNVSICNKK